MSLRDVIDGARQEAQANRDELRKTDRDNDGKPADDQEDSYGFTRRSASRAKPVRDKAGSVRVVEAGKSSSKPKSEMTRAEKKAEREKERDRDDRRRMVRDTILEQTEGYGRSQKIWWIMLGIGMGCTIISFGLNQTMGASTEGAIAPQFILIMLAYVCIIGAFVYDFVKARPLRKKADEQVRAMTDKKVNKFIHEVKERERKAAAEKEKAKKKGEQVDNEE